MSYLDTRFGSVPFSMYSFVRGLGHTLLTPRGGHVK